MVALMYLLSEGWTTTTFQLDRNQLTNTIFIAGGIYLLQLSQEYANDQGDVARITVTSLSLIAYTCIGYTIMRNTRRRARLLRRMLTEHLDDIPRSYVDSLKVKQ